MSCDGFADALADFLEQEVDETTRATMEAHALACADCGALLADLRALRVDAAHLPTHSPSRDLWAGIAERIEAPVVELSGRGAIAPSRDSGRRMRGVPSWARTALAAAVLVAVTSGVTYYATRASLGGSTGRVAQTPRPTATTPVPTTVATPTTTVASAASAPRTDGVPDTTRSETPAAGSRGTSPVRSSPMPAGQPARLASTRAAGGDATYDREIARLRAILVQRRSQLDPATITVVEHNLRVIDDAIAQCRSALAKDPASRFLIESLNSALESKVELLRTAALLPART